MTVFSIFLILVTDRWHNLWLWARLCCWDGNPVILHVTACKACVCLDWQMEITSEEERESWQSRPIGVMVHQRQSWWLACIWAGICWIFQTQDSVQAFHPVVFQKPFLPLTIIHWTSLTYTHPLNLIWRFFCFFFLEITQLSFGTHWFGENWRLCFN